MYYVYVLKCNNSDLYIGYSENLKRRFEEHQLGKVTSTKSKRPVVLVYYEAYKIKSDATKREYNLKTGQQRELLRKRINNSIK
ncbi:GIY-YIG nuclease family protein [Candidatus Gottesmanbacteria bacterium]|nr:GIY-YIG nuclease family protein [Candidatus Gottesmanbacteria bacterium]